MPIVPVTRQARERAHARLVATGGIHLVPVLEALGAGVAMTIMPPGKIPFPDLPKGRPWLVIVGDDLVFADGPAGFHLRSLRKLFARASAVFVMSGGPVQSAYEAAADSAKAGLRVIIVETQTAEELAWLDYAHRHAPKAAKLMATPNFKTYRNAA